uniref:Tripartite motif containing 39 n=1 Tax=Terrapene triunguis TaxID=2587831 RepID=A0A674K5G2_9SAUR
YVIKSLLAASSAQESETNPQGLVPRCRGAMVAGDLAGSFQHEVTCSVCLEYFTDPVTTECGHNFCWACISQCWGEPEPNFSCPQCRETAPQRDLRPNRQLGNLVELVKRLRLQAGPEPEGQKVCKRHQETLKLFCEEDQAPTCMVCDRSRAHHAHTVVPIEEAAQEYRVADSYLHCWELQGHVSCWSQLLKTMCLLICAEPGIG